MTPTPKSNATNNTASTAAVPAALAGELAKFLDIDPSGYLLRMYWLGRWDKIPDREMPLLEWLTRAFVPGSLLVAYEGFRPGQVSFRDQDHMMLVAAVMLQAQDAVLIRKGLPASGLSQ